MLFRGLCRQYVTHAHLSGEIDGGVERHGELIAVVAGEGKGTVGQRERDATVRDTKSVHHLLAHLHADDAVAGAHIQHFDP